MRTYRRLMGFLRPYRPQLWGSLVFAWAAMGMTVLIPWLIGRAVNAIESGHRPDLLPLALAIAGAGLLRLGLTAVRRVVAGRVSLAVEFDLRQSFYAHLQRLELAFFDSQQTGQLMSRATVDLQAIRFFLGYGLIFITQNLLTIALAAAVMLAINPWLALIALAPAPLVVLTARRYSRVSRPALQEVQQRIAELTAEAEENVSGIRIVKAFAREEHQLRRFRRAVERVFDQSVYSTRLQAFFSPLIGLLPQLGIALVLLVGGREVIAGNLSLGSFTAFYTYLAMLAAPMRMLGAAMGMAQRAVASGNRLFEVLDREPRIESPPGAPPLPTGGGRVELRGVTLRYDGALARRNGDASVSDPSHLHEDDARIDALADVDLEVEAGRTVALVGPSGSGKTSLVALVARLYDPSEGTVLVDGADVRSVDVVSLRSQVAFVADDSFLFSASIAENIAYARPDASREEIEAAARRARADEFVRELPAGYDTVVGERGLTLSGGQRQRIAIARALLADPRILILDDATSSVDATTEAAIKAGLQEAMAGRTTFIIAHRLSTVSLAD
ncbi:MAG TPA: ABC transporter ATP-binding protein, partial [Solirubrobacterales bacterium]|nr:ABC transporter ATP-binding protein [Solirubrobacterales bacterium]